MISIPWIYTQTLSFAPQETRTRMLMVNVVYMVFGDSKTSQWSSNHIWWEIHILEMDLCEVFDTRIHHGELLHIQVATIIVGISGRYFVATNYVYKKPWSQFEPKYSSIDYSKLMLIDVLITHSHVPSLSCCNMKTHCHTSLSITTRSIARKLFS